MKSFLQALNRPTDAFHQMNVKLSLALVAFTILINVVFEPILHNINGIGHTAIDIFQILRLSALGCASYLAICIILWAVCKCFGSKATLGTYLKTWGITYFPTMLCSFVVAFTETFFYIFWNSMVWGMILNIIFGGILIWKTTLCVIFFHEVAGLKKVKLVGAFILVNILILILAALSGYLGLKTPIL